MSLCPACGTAFLSWEVWPKICNFWMCVSTTYPPFLSLQKPSKFIEHLCQLSVSNITAFSSSTCWPSATLLLLRFPSFWPQNQQPRNDNPEMSPQKDSVWWSFEFRTPADRKSSIAWQHKKCCSNAKPRCEMSLLPVWLVFSFWEQFCDKINRDKSSCVMLPKFMCRCCVLFFLWGQQHWNNARSVHCMFANYDFQCCRLILPAGWCLNS